MTAGVQALHQFVPFYVGPSAIATHTYECQRAIRDLGLQSDIYAAEWRGVPHTGIHRWKDHRADPTGRSWVMYQLSTGHDMADGLAASRDPLIVNYHNVTPEAFVKPWEPLHTPELRAGRAQLQALAPRSSLGIAVSRYNEAEMRAAGYAPTTTVPVLVDFETLNAEEDRSVASRLAAAKQDGGADWLFVGRVAPNKAQHRVIMAFAAYRRLYDRRARLWLVGGTASHRYQTVLRALVDHLGLGSAVTLTASVSQAALVAYYRAADVFVCCSEHEGFGIPLVEAQIHGVPVVAVDTSGVGATVGEGGILLPAAGPRPLRTGTAGPGGALAGARDVRQPAPAVVAAAAHRAVSDAALRSRLVAAGHAQAARFDLAATRSQLQSTLAAAMDL